MAPRCEGRPPWRGSYTCDLGLITCTSVALLFELKSGCQVYTSRRFVRFILAGLQYELFYGALGKFLS